MKQTDEHPSLLSQTAPHSTPDNTPQPVMVTETGEELYEHQRVQVPAGQRPMRLDSYISQSFSSCTRSRAKKGLSDGFFRLNDTRSKASTSVRPGDQIALWLPYPPLPDAGPEPMDLDILHEDEDILVINKQSGVICHPTVNHRSGTLFQGILAHLGYTHGRKDADPTQPWPGLVHRLDRETSGVMVVGKHHQAVVALARQFFHRTIERRYQAIVWGAVQEQRVDAPLGGKRAVTHVSVIEPFEIATLVQCRLETGRTHQIRLHLSQVSHPLLADQRYGGGWEQQETTDIQALQGILQRTALHARSLAFTHPNPLYLERMFFRVEMPEDMERLHQKLQSFQP